MTDTNNVMRNIVIEKIVLNMGCGTTVPVENAKKILEQIAGSKAILIKTKKRSLFGVPRGKPIGCMVTMRKNVSDVLKRLFKAKDDKLKVDSFDNLGNFAFGISEYIDIPGMNYEPKIGMLGLDVCVTLKRPGYSIKRRAISKKVGKKHLITKEEAIQFVKNNFEVNIE